MLLPLYSICPQLKIIQLRLGQSLGMILETPRSIVLHLDHVVVPKGNVKNASWFIQDAKSCPELNFCLYVNIYCFIIFFSCSQMAVLYCNVKKIHLEKFLFLLTSPSEKQNLYQYNLFWFFLLNFLEMSCEKKLFCTFGIQFSIQNYIVV